MGIRVPRITIKADFGNEASFGELRPLCIGYGLHQAWIYATMFGASSVFGIDTLIKSANNGAVSMAFLASIVAFGITLLVGSATDQKFLNFYVSRKTLLWSSIALSAGTLLLLLPPLGQTVDLALQVASGLITGVASAFLILLWGTAFARHEHATIVLNTAIAIAVAVTVYAVVLHHIPTPWCGLVAGLLPLGALPFLYAETPKPYTERNDYPIFQPLPVKRGPFALKFGLPVAMFGIALGALRQTSIQTILPAATGTEQLLAILASCCALVLILITLLALNSARRWNRLFRPLVPFIAVVAFFFPLSELGDLSFSGFFLLVGYMSFEALIWIFFGEFSQEYRLSPVLVFGLGRGTLALTSVIGSMLPIFTLTQADLLPFGTESLIVVLLFVMVVAYALLPRESEVQRMVADCPLVKVINNGGLDHTNAIAQHAALGNSETLLANEPSAAANASNAESGERAAHSAASDQTIPATESSKTPGRDVAAQDAATSESAASKSSADGLWPAEKRGRFKRKCEIIANRYLLSQRETEVLFFLAKGHNATSIQEQLYISEGTTKTHIRHIYRKLDIHSQQELIQVVENAED